MNKRSRDGTSPKKLLAEKSTQKATKSPAGSVSAQSKAASRPSAIVGIGASAGGLEAFTEFLRHLPTDTGMGFVLVQHLDPSHQSLLPELLSKTTRRRVTSVEDGMPVRPNEVYVIPPNRSMTIANGVLHLGPREERHGYRLVDEFFRSLGKDQKNHGIGVVLSGTASDGTIGLESIKAEGGITFAQDASAKYDGMPRSAIAAGHVDFVLPPAGIAEEIARIGRHPYVRPAAQKRSSDTHPLESKLSGDGYQEILRVVRGATGLDFTNYRANTMRRRIIRRTIMHKLPSMTNYATYLQSHPAEAEVLMQDLLIKVTSFFRNPEVFDALKNEVFPKLLEKRKTDEPLRVWISGCSTGEEAYSMAMSYVEFVGGRDSQVPIQIYATDVDGTAIDRARHGLYSKSQVHHLSPERVRRFFVETEAGYRVNKTIRDMCIFARQNLMTDPPFSRIDLISCRNVLIYLEPVLQRRIIPMFHYALKPGGFLLLGLSEAIGTDTDLFAPIDRKHKIYAKKPARRADFGVRADKLTSQTTPSAVNTERTREVPGFDPYKEADRILVTKYTPASVMVNGRMEIMQVRGSTSAYLEAPSGKATHNVLKMAREGLMLPLREALNQAKKEDRRVQTPGVRVKHNGHSREIRLDVVPINGASADDHYFLILFRPALLPADSVPPGRTRKKTARQSKQLDKRRLADLENQFQAGREYSQSLLEQQEAYTEELQSANEEIQSSNEELQSINEELETAKEELESSNEELSTVNEELQSRNRETHQLNTDLSNLLTNVRMPILMIDADLCLRRFTPAAAKTLNLTDTDIGRPISELKLSEIPDLPEMVAQVLNKVNALDREVRDSQGHWYKLYVGPYIAPENKIDGVVVVLTDIHVLKQIEEVIQASRDYAEAIVETVKQPLVILNADLRVKTANASFYATFHVSPADTENQLIFDLGNKQWDRPELRRLLEQILPGDSQFQHFEIHHGFPSIGPRTVQLNARKLRLQNQDPMILMTIEDITERKQAVEESLRESEERFQIAADSAPVMIWLSGLDKLCTFFNKPWLEFTGRTMEEELCNGWTEGIHPEDYNRCLEVYVTSFEAKKPFKMDYRLRRHDGEYRWLLDHGIPRFSSSGAFLGYIGSCIDITERIESEDALRASELRFRTMVSAIPSPTYETDADGNNIFVSDQWLAHTGMTAMETAGNGFIKAYHPNEAGDVLAQWSAAVQSGMSFESKCRIRAADGSYRWFLNRAQPGRDAEGKIVGWAGSLTDIDDLIRIEEALRESKERLAGIVSTAMDAIITVNEDHRIVLFNEAAERMFGCMAAEAMGQTIERFIPECFSRATARLRSLTALRTDGTEFPIEAAISTIEVGGRKLYTIIHRDITERKQAEKEREELAREQAARAAAEDANRSKDEFLSVVSHELRSPLTPILGYTRMLAAGQLDRAAIGNMTAIVERNAKAQLQIIEDLLDSGRITTGKLRIDWAAVDLAPVLEAALETVRLAAEAKGVTLEADFGALSEQVLGDSTRMQQVVWNLLANAVKFTAKGGRVALRIESDADNVRIKVSDTGKGIEPEFLPFVFDRFRQADSTSTRRYGGLGLGLSIVKHLVEAHGGTILAASEGLGRGATFTVTLPRRQLDFVKPPGPAVAPREVRTESSITADQDVSLEGVRVLVVDDQEDARQLLIHSLSEYGAQVTAVSSGAEALSFLSNLTVDRWPHALILDIAMPDEDGYSVLKKVRALEAMQDAAADAIPAIALTAYGRTEDRLRALQAGFQMHVSKPVEPVELAVVIERLTTRRAWERERAG